MATKWTTVTFGEVVTLAQGLCFNAKSNHLMAETGIPLLRIADLINNTQTKFVDAERVPKKYISNPNDIIYTRTGQVGLVFKGKVGVLHNNCFRVIPQNGVEADYVYWYLRQPSVIEKARSLAGGAAQPDLGHDAFKSISFTYPEPEMQRRIAGILSAYDELMENSQRRIKILESMARSLYREWFVHFRFSGHEKVPLVASPLGKIPQGWEVCALGDLVQFKSGFAFKSGTFTADGEHRLVTIKNVQDGAFNPESDSRMSELPPNLPPYCVLKDGDILLSLTGNVGRVCLVYDGPFLLNQRVSKLAPVEAFDWAMSYCMFREPEMRVKLEQLSNGVAQQNLSPVLASKMEFALPTRELRQRFAALAEPMVRRIVQLYSTIQNLRRTRDLLLPRLLSGQVELETEVT